MRVLQGHEPQDRTDRFAGKSAASSRPAGAGAGSRVRQDGLVEPILSANLLQLGVACGKDGPPSAGPRLFLRRRSSLAETLVQPIARPVARRQTAYARPRLKLFLIGAVVSVAT